MPPRGRLVPDYETVITCASSEYLIPKFEIFVDQSLSFTLRTFGWMLSDDHELYSNYNRSFLNVTLSNFISHLNQFNLCNGLTTPDPSKELNFQKHVIPKTFNYSNYQQLLFKPRTHQDEYYRSNNCKLLLSNQSSSESICSFCCSAHQRFTFQKNKKVAALNQPAKLR